MMRKKVIVEAALVREAHFPQTADGRRVLRPGKPDHAFCPLGTAAYLTPRMTG